MQRDAWQDRDAVTKYLAMRSGGLTVSSLIGARRQK